jgi:hypothetical protein
VSQAKSFVIPKQLVWEAYKRVKANQGAAGVDAESVEQFERKLKDNLYKIWNRMSSGTYFPPPVRTVAIPNTTFDMLHDRLGWRWQPFFLHIAMKYIRTGIRKTEAREGSAYQQWRTE